MSTSTAASSRHRFRTHSARWVARWLLTPILLASLLAGCDTAAPAGQVALDSDQTFADAYDERLNDLQVSGEGTVIRILSDDDDGARHQRFIVRLASGQTLLITHNIDVAPRIPSLEVGDTVIFAGVYEWNDEGGVVHWTHHDPDGRHQPGWIEHDGTRYQ